MSDGGDGAAKGRGAFRGVFAVDSKGFRTHLEPVRVLLPEAGALEQLQQLLAQLHGSCAQALGHAVAVVWPAQGHH